MALQVGSRLGHYSVTAKIGEGGMGEVRRWQEEKSSRTPGPTSTGGSVSICVVHPTMNQDETGETLCDVWCCVPLG